MPDLEADLFQLAMSKEAEPLMDAVKKHIADNVEPIQEEFSALEKEKEDRWSWHPKQLELLEGAKQKAKDSGLWNFFLPDTEYGQGLNNLDYAYIAAELGKFPLASESLNCSAPDTGNMEVLERVGTPEQKKQWLEPLLNGEKRICYSMTEKAAGADATGMQTRAELDGDEWVLNGEKWFSSSASVADIAVVMAKTDPDAPRHEQYSTFIVELPNPGYQILRDIETMQPHTELGLKLGGSHSEIKIEDLRVPRENILGGRGQGFNMGQHRLAYGRLRHGMHNVAMAQRALDLAAEQVVNRVTFGERLADRQGVRWMLADCAAEIYKARLMLLHIAYKAEKGMDLRQENGIAKVFLANMVHQVVDTALQLHGALGYSHDTPLARWYTGIRSQRLVDGPDEVHRWRTGANVIKAYEKYGTTAPACGGELFD